MYDELIKSTHCCFGFEEPAVTDCENCMMKDKREEHNYVGCCDALGLAAAEAIEELQKVVEKEQAFAKCWEEMATDCKDRFQKLLDTYPKWIPVEERLPKENAPCIVYNKDYGPMVGWRVDGERFRIPGSRFPDHPTHWMPLPQPPKEG